MLRTARASEAGMIYHVLNRGNGRMRIFHKARDFDAFERVLAEGFERYSVDLLTRGAARRDANLRRARPPFRLRRLAATGPEAAWP